jgi:CRISPR system Cascade subunit CasD
LVQFADALRRPHFTLYFGRKACPLSAPLDPRTVEADDPRRAIRAYVTARTPEQTEFLRDLHLHGLPAVLALDLDGANDHTGRMRVERRRDALESRRRWQFGLRSEALVGGRE